MIVKSISFKTPSFGKLLKYIAHSKDRLLDNEGRSFLITHNLKGKSISDWERQYKENEEYRIRRRKDSVIITHEILSWHKDDAKKMTPEKMRDIAREYIQKRNPKGMYVAVPHFDKDHYHIHICTSGVGYRTGKSLRMSKPEFGKLKRDIQKYQVEKYPELSKSTVDHGKKGRFRRSDRSETSEKEFQLKRRSGRETQKEMLTGMLKTCYKKASSKADFYKNLEESGLKTYERRGRVTGVILNSTKHRFTRLGFEEKRSQELDRTDNRDKELREVRNYSFKNYRGR